MMYSRIARTKQ